MRFHSAFLVCLLCSGCQPKHTTMPQGFELVCDGNGHYAAMRVLGKQILGTARLNEQPFTDRQSAINRAWFQFEFEARPEPPEPAWHRTMKKCDDK